MHLPTIVRYNCNHMQLHRSLISPVPCVYWLSPALSTLEPHAFQHHLSMSPLTSDISQALWFLTPPISHRQLSTYHAFVHTSDHPLPRERSKLVLCFVTTYIRQQPRYLFSLVNHVQLAVLTFCIYQYM